MWNSGVSSERIESSRLVEATSSSAAWMIPRASTIEMNAFTTVGS